MDWTEKFAAFIGVDPNNIPWRSDKKSKALMSIAMADEDELTVQDEPEPDPPSAPTTQQQTPPAPAAFSETEDGKAMQAEIDRLKSQAAEFERREKERAAEALRSRAATFAADWCRERKGEDGKPIPAKITPAAQPVVAALFMQAAQDDAAAQAVVTFSADGKEQKVSRVDALTALFAALPGHNLLGQHFSPDGGLDPAKARVLFSDAGDKDGTITDERRRELLELTPTGQAYLASLNGNNK